MAITKKKSEHYVNNKEFLAAMVEYKKIVNKAKRDKLKNPTVPDYIGECFSQVRLCIFPVVFGELVSVQSIYDFLNFFFGYVTQDWIV